MNLVSCFDWLLSDWSDKNKHWPSLGSLTEGQQKWNSKQIELYVWVLSDGLPELTDDTKWLTRETENRVSLYPIMLPRLNVNTALASVISKLSVFGVVIIYWCLTHSNRKKFSVSTPQQVERTAPTKWEHTESLWTWPSQCVKIQDVTLEPKWLLRTWHLGVTLC